MNVLIVGKGIAGNVRARIYRHNSNQNLFHFSRRECDIYDDSLYLQQYTGVHICTENSSHFDLIRYFLHERKLHVCVEYPLANQLEQITSLYSLARNQNLVLHCAFISLLSYVSRIWRSILPPFSR